MIWHPLTWIFWVAAATGVVIYLAAAVRALDVVWDWAPQRSDRAQLRRERRGEIAALLGRWSLGCLTAAALIGLTGIVGAWHRVIPGAMCGTGVLQAMGANGSRAMVFWSAALLILHAWRVLDRLDSHHPEGVLTRTSAQVMLTVAPLLVLALSYSWLALMRIDPVPPVSCCAAVYDQVLHRPSASAAAKASLPITFWGSLAGGAVLLVWMTLKMRFPDRGSGTLLLLLTLFWALASAITVKQVWSAYYYQVLSHPCPWCLFLGDYHGAGFLIFGCLAVVLMEGVALWLADKSRRRHPILRDPARRQIRRSAFRIVLGLIGFTILTAGPAMAWRLRTGVWLNGFF